MTITRDNYEPFFLDYLEGKLKENMIDEFLDFLEQNPDLKEELHLFEDIHLPEEQVVYSGKTHLYKSTAEENTAFELKTIALMEGDLKDEERRSFKTYLADHPELKKESELMAKTRLIADTDIKYPHKKSLYKRPGAILWLNWAVRVAAVAAIFWGINSLFQTGSQTTIPLSNQQIASVKTPPVVPAKKVEPTAKTMNTETGEKPVPKTQPATPHKSKPTNMKFASTPEVTTANPVSSERDLTVPEEIHPIMASLETEQVETSLAIAHTVNLEKIKDMRNVIPLDKFLASRAKRVGGESLLSANQIIRTGLNVASELSGDRLGYREKNGKITSLDFESKLMAFSIPLQKK
ncbi:MAG TPA: hypothetical protein DCL77_16580 [Prolixibacteraceae bacterium]|jgi:hypothetical protein|nr:hypothetical protein [Prolixibacteraceae bacterium]